MPNAYPILIFLAAVAVLVVAMVFFERRRRAGVQAALEARNFTVAMKLDGAERELLFGPMTSLEFLRHGARGMKWHARGQSLGRDVVVIEHSYTTGSGKNKRTVNNTAAALLGRSGAGWPLLSLTGESIFHRIGEKFGGIRDVQLEDERFNRRWRIKCNDEDFALAMLNPEVQQLLADADRREWWAVGGPASFVCIGRNAAVTGAQLDHMLTRLGEMVRAMAPEARQGLGVDTSGR